MAHDDMARNGKPKPGAALMARSGAIHAVKAFGQTRQMVPGNAGTVIGHAQQGAGARCPILCRSRCERDGDQATFTAMIDGIFQDIADHLRHLIRIGRPRHQTFCNIKREAHVAPFQ